MTAPPLPLLPPAEEAGHDFGGYRIAQVLATGGMATVYLARKDGPGGFAQNAAIKVIHPHLAQEPEYVEMFLDEASIASCINHPNVCRVLSFGESERSYYLALEYVRGETWADTVEAFDFDRLPVSERMPFAVHVVAQACEGLHAAHEALDPSGEPMDIVHRDVSPENLLVAYDGSVRVVDFGVAIARKRRHQTETGAVRGRYAYMAPEQMSGQAVDRRADVWSLGVVLREALEGRHPFRQPTDPETIHAVLHGEVPAWHDHVPPRLREIVDRCLHLDRDARYESAREVGRALSGWLMDSAHASVAHTLGEHMHRLFYFEIEAKRSLLADLSRTDSGALYQSGERPSRGLLPVQRVEPGVVAAMGASPSPVPARNGPLLSRWGAGLGLLAGLLLLAAACAGGLHLWRLGNLATADTGAPGAAVQTSEGAPGAYPKPTAPDETLPELGTQLGRPLDDGPDAEHRRRARARARGSRGAAPSGDRGERKMPVTSGPGTLVVGARSGWAQVNVDGKQLGNTPIRLELPSGRHTVTTVPFGTGAPTQHHVRVGAGESTKLVVQL